MNANDRIYIPIWIYSNPSEGLRSHSSCRFTFQYGSTQINKLHFVEVLHYNLHSNMDLLKSRIDPPEFRYGFYLHSNMDLLKSKRDTQVKRVFKHLHSNMDLLKLKTIGHDSDGNIDLHSNMDLLKF